MNIFKQAREIDKKKLIEMTDEELIVLHKASKQGFCSRWTQTALYIEFISRPNMASKW